MLVKSRLDTWHPAWIKSTFFTATQEATQCTNCFLSSNYIAEKNKTLRPHGSYFIVNYQLKIGYQTYLGSSSFLRDRRSIYSSGVGAVYMDTSLESTLFTCTQWLVATHMYFIFKNCHQQSLSYNLEIRKLKACSCLVVSR